MVTGQFAPISVQQLETIPQRRNIFFSLTRGCDKAFCLLVLGVVATTHFLICFSFFCRTDKVTAQHTFVSRRPDVLDPFPADALYQAPTNSLQRRPSRPTCFSQRVTTIFAVLSSSSSPISLFVTYRSRVPLQTSSPSFLAQVRLALSQSGAVIHS